MEEAHGIGERVLDKHALGVAGDEIAGGRICVIGEQKLFSSAGRLERRGIRGQGSTGISPAVLLGSGTYIEVRALPCRSAWEFM